MKLTGISKRMWFHMFGVFFSWFGYTEVLLFILPSFEATYSVTLISAIESVVKGIINMLLVRSSSELLFAISTRISKVILKSSSFPLIALLFMSMAKLAENVYHRKNESYGKSYGEGVSS